METRSEAAEEAHVETRSTVLHDGTGLQGYCRVYIRALQKRLAPQGTAVRCSGSTSHGRHEACMWHRSLLVLLTLCPL